MSTSFGATNASFSRGWIQQKLSFLGCCILMLALVVSASLDELPWGDVNVMVVTDVHSWIGGHIHESEHNADYGDVLSFYEHLKAYSQKRGYDLWFVNNGDWLHGTGLAMGGNATKLIPLLQKMPWDVMTIGNHEIYHHATVSKMLESGGLLETFKDGYLTSNVMYSANTSQPLGKRYRVLHGEHSNVLVFGFLYNLKNAAEMLHVNRVQDTVKEEWFIKAIQDEEYDSIMVLSHMDVNDPLVKVIKDAIRANSADDKKQMPIQFITGHTHIRAETKIDAYSHSFEAGAFMDTIGFVSFPTIHAEKIAKQFKFEFIDANSKKLKELVGSSTEFATERGRELSQLIDTTQIELGLRQVVACPPRDYHYNRSMFHSDSLWRLYREVVAPDQLFQDFPNMAMFVYSDAWRYDLRSGPIDGSNGMNVMTMDDVIAVAPYNEPIYYVGEIPAWKVKKMNSSLNTESTWHHNILPDWVLVGEFDDNLQDKDLLYKLFSHESNLPHIEKELKRLYHTEFEMQKTGETDTMVWLNFVQEKWPCPGNKERAKPWWMKDPYALEIEVGDGDESHDSTDEFEGLHTDGHDNDVIEDRVPDAPSYTDGGGASGGSGGGGGGSGGSGSGGSSSTPDSTGGTTNNQPINTGVQKGDAFPGARQEPLKPVSHYASQNNHKKEDNEKTKKSKTKSNIKKIVALTIAAGILILPLVGMYYALHGKNNDLDGVTFYDPEEVKSLKLGGDGGGSRRRSNGGGGRSSRGRSGRGRRRGSPSRPAMEIEIM